MGKFSEIVNGNQPVLVDFFATWCGPCKAMTPVLQDLAGRLGTKARIIKVDVDKNPEAAAKFKVMGVPTLILFHRGEIKWRQSGVVPANTIERIINEHLID